MMTVSPTHPTILTRSPNGMLGGVCEGMAQRYDVPVGLIRLSWLISVFFIGTGLLLYFLLWWIVPRADAVPAEATAWGRDEVGQLQAPWARTQVDRMFLGVCGGLARRWQVDPSLVRLCAVGLAIMSLGTSILIYLLGAVVLPSQSEASHHPNLRL